MRVSNLPMNLPIDILTDSGTQHIVLKEKEYAISSQTMPVVDAKRFYLKTVSTD